MNINKVVCRLLIGKLSQHVLSFKVDCINFKSQKITKINYHDCSILLNITYRTSYFINKSDISYQKPARPLMFWSTQASQILLVSDSCRHHEYLAARFWRFRSQSASHHCVYIASTSRYPSRSCNCGRLLIAATQSSHLNCRSRLK